MKQPKSNAHEFPLIEAAAEPIGKPDAATLWLLDTRSGVQGESSLALLRYHLTGKLPGLSEYPYDIYDFWRCWNLCRRVPGVRQSLHKLGVELNANGWRAWVVDYEAHEAIILANPHKFPKL